MPRNATPVIVHVVNMGDSITFGQYIDPALRWTSLIDQRLQLKYRDQRVIVGTVNRGVSGETTRMALERFSADVQSARPDIMTLQFGLNDCNCWLSDAGLPRVSEDAFRANLVEMITRARYFGAKQIVLANNHCTLRLKESQNGEKYESANARYSEIAGDVAKQTKVAFCDIRERFSRFSEIELVDLLLPYPDLLHLSVAGNEVYAETMAPYVEQAVAVVVEAKQNQSSHEAESGGGESTIPFPQLRSA